MELKRGSRSELLRKVLGIWQEVGQTQIESKLYELEPKINQDLKEGFSFNLGENTHFGVYLKIGTHTHILVARVLSGYRLLQDTIWGEYQTTEGIASIVLKKARKEPITCKVYLGGNYILTESILNPMFGHAQKLLSDVEVSEVDRVKTIMTFNKIAITTHPVWTKER